MIRPGAYLITGISGSGKTTLFHHIKALGHHAIDGDANFGYHPEIADKNNHEIKATWFYDQEALRNTLRLHAGIPTFVFGNGDNEHQYLALFQKIFCLHASSRVIMQRLQSPLREHGYGWETSHRKEIAERIDPYYTAMKKADVLFIDAEQTTPDIAAEILEEVLE